MSINEARNLHGHRARTRDQLQEEAFRLGLKSIDQLSLEHIDDHSGGGRRVGNKHPIGRFNPPQALLSRHIPRPQGSNPPASSKVTPNPNRDRPEHGRPWPPAPPLGTPSPAPDTRLNASPAKAVIKRMPGIAGGGQIPAKAAPMKPPPAPVRQPQAFILSDPSDFMSAVKGPSKKAEQSNNEAPAPKVSAGHDTPAPPPAAAAQENVHPNLSDPSIRRVPIEEFSFPAAAALAPGEVATHTDGAPSPMTLSGFSASTDMHEQAPVSTESHGSDLIGLGIGNVEVQEATTVLDVHQSSNTAAQVSGLSPTGSIMDSPILDDVKSDVLPAQPGNFIEFAGRKYVSLDELLALREAIERHISTAVTTDAAAARSFEKPTEAVDAPRAQRTVASSTTSSSTPTTAVPARHVNPFAPREPVSNDYANTSATAAPSADIKKEVPAVKPEKAPTTTRTEPFTSKTTISSKWGDEPSDQPARSTPFSSKTTIKSKWGDDPSPQPSPVPITSVRTPSPIIGDRRVFGAKGAEYDPPPTQAAQKRKFHEPGPGFYALVQSYANMNLGNGNERT
ncbi:hypothetical protein G647_05997 [Cladophialophora carrionii CBS 160.54]|uniref:Uncharacterized protein n=1 Tax=Cladophialophora carrionii CBS 160.54 TaxID=1279043 RepID=V9D7J1_9EURO|nr:uncharacterized protein G647_05997 [Cladophialophora carrionii CBS 160.54]ETI21927.1 hypothetical protein G647_05997 [Cladophialophora carrionii CBS 160.54]